MLQSVPAVGAASVCLSAFGEDSIRVLLAPTNVKPIPSPYSALLPDPPAQTQPVPPPVCVLDAQNLSLANGNLLVRFEGGMLRAVRLSDGAVLLQQTRLRFFPSPPRSARASFGASIEFAGQVGERVYGLGEHRNGRVEQMGFTHNFQDSQAYSASHGADIMIPYYGSSHGYGFLWASPSYGNVSLTEAALAWTAYAVTAVDLWITTVPAAQAPPTAPAQDPGHALHGKDVTYTTSGPEAPSPLAVLLQRYADAVGHAAPLPWYASGFWQCKNRYRSQDQLLAVARGYVARGLPISIIVIDYMHWTHFGDWSFNPQCWPDVPGMVAELQSLGIELAVTFWPMVTPAGAYFDVFNRSGHFFRNLTTNQSAPLESWAGPMYCVDETNPAAQDAIFEAFWQGYGQYGIRTLWLDGSEPERSGAYNFGQFELWGGTDTEVGEAWVREHAAAIARGMASRGYGPGDFVTLARSSWSGAGAHSSAVWSGDISSTFAELAIQVKVAQSFALSGQALWTTDIGGYAGGDPANPEFRELIVRWFQFGAFCPLFRLHGHRAGGPPSDECGETGGDNEVWNLAPQQDHYDAIVRVMQLREDLRDYVLRINSETVATGLPMVRAMVLAFPADPAAAAAEDQYMFGPDWLVAPVTVYRATTRTVVLPQLGAGQVWQYWWNQSRVYAGGQTVTVDTSIAEFPLFRRTTLDNLQPLVALYSATRHEQVLCVTLECLSDQVPLGNYSVQRDEGRTLAAPVEVWVNGTAVAVAPLWLYWSETHMDNIVTTDATPPDSSYNFTIANGFVFADPVPGTVPLQLWFKALSWPAWDYATVASPAGEAWARALGYLRIKSAIGYVYPPPTAGDYSSQVAAAL